LLAKPRNPAFSAFGTTLAIEYRKEGVFHAFSQVTQRRLSHSVYMANMLLKRRTMFWPEISGDSCARVTKTSKGIIMDQQESKVCGHFLKVENEAGAITTDVVKLLTQIESLLEENHRSSMSGPELARDMKVKTQALLGEFGFSNVYPVIHFRRRENGEYGTCVRFLSHQNTFFWSHLKVEST
jgi:hypothetical protein